MTKLEELERAIACLSEEEYREFRDWFLQKDWEKWDKEIAEDENAGKLSFLAKEALEAKKTKRLKAL